MSAVDKAAREIYRRLYPGPIGTHDSKRTPESDRAEHDRAYQTWDEGRAGYAPSAICRDVAEALDREGLLADPDEVRRLRDFEAHFPCDGLCTPNSGPEEDCSRHGRRPAEVWGIVAEVQAERDRLRARLTAVEALAEQYTVAGVPSADLRAALAGEGQ